MFHLQHCSRDAITIESCDRAVDFIASDGKRASQKVIFLVAASKSSFRGSPRTTTRQILGPTFHFFTAKKEPDSDLENRKISIVVRISLTLYQKSKQSGHSNPRENHTLYMIKKLALTLAVIGAIALPLQYSSALTFSPLAVRASNASDNASNAAYTPGNDFNGLNGGTGFGNWSNSNFNPGGGFSGEYVGNTADGNPAFGLFASASGDLNGQMLAPLIRRPRRFGRSAVERFRPVRHSLLP